MKASEIFALSLLQQMCEEGYVRVQTHPDFPKLAIYNYTEKAQFENVWNAVTLTCRGLILNWPGDVVARPFPKFQNYGHPLAAKIPLDQQVTVSDKMDGSLGILYRTPDGESAIATRGSFASEQAIHATKVLKERYPNFKYNSFVTPLFEIIYPENRIVLDYEDLDDLVLIGAVSTRYGYIYTPKKASKMLYWEGPVATVFEYETLAEALDAPPRVNAEGFVVTFGNDMVKIKQDDYVALHKIVTGLNERVVWEYAKEDKLEILFVTLPDEFHNWVQYVADNLAVDVNKSYNIAQRAYEQVRRNLPEDWTRRDFALAIKDHPLAWAMFSILDNKDILSKLWEKAKPAGNIPPSKWSPDES